MPSLCSAFSARFTVSTLSPLSLCSVSCDGSHWPSLPRRLSSASATYDIPSVNAPLRRWISTVKRHRQLRKGRRLGGPFGYGGIAESLQTRRTMRQVIYHAAIQERRLGL